MNAARTIAPLLILLLFGVLFAKPSEATDGDAIRAATDSAVQQYHAGDVLAAKRALKEIVLKEPTETARVEYRYALLALLETCESVYDYACVTESFIRIIDLPLSTDEPERHMLEKTYSALISLSSINPGLVAEYVDFANSVFEVFDASYSQMLIVAPDLYVPANLAQAEVLINLDREEEAGLPLDRAMSALVTMEQPQNFFLAKNLRTSVDLLLQIGQGDRANRLINVAYPFLTQAGDLSVPESIHIHMVLGRVFAARNEISLSRSAYETAIELLNSLIVNKDIRDWLAGDALVNIAALCILADDFQCAEAALARHPVATDANLVEKERFKSLAAYQYAAAKIIVDVKLGSDVPEDWLDALQYDASGVSDKEYLDLMKPYGVFARGYALSAGDGVSNIRESESMQAAMLRLSWLEHESVGFYQPDVADRFFLQIGMLLNAKLSSREERTDRDDDTFLRMIQANNRSLRDIDGDRLWKLSSAKDEIERRRVHSVDRLRSRQMYLESELLAKQIHRVLGNFPDGFSWDYNIDFEAFGRLAGLNETRRRIDAMGSLGTSDSSVLHVDLETTQTSLKQNEALISVTVAGDSILGICVRPDRSFVMANPFDDHQFARNLKTIQEELQSQERPSYKRDSTFDFNSAVAMYDMLFAPFEECLGGVEHIVWIPPAPLSLFPIGVLLSENPPGNDLSAAQWLARTYAFSYATSVRAFIAARNIDVSNSADRSFLGVGDPVLSASIANGKTGGERLVADAVRTRSGALDSLWELPETSTELRSIASLESDKSALLLREAATEQDFRNQVLGRYQAIGFATHGLIRSDGTPNRESALVLTPVNPQYSWNDGLLTAGEIADLSLRAKMVTLSACNAANFDWSVWAGETLGLTTAFATAGVPALMATLWRVDSDTSAQITTGLYSALVAGGPRISPASALLKSTIEFLESPPSRTHYHPRYWAPFVMFGDGGTEWEDGTANFDRPNKTDYLGRFHRGGAFSDVRIASSGRSAYVSGYGDMVNERYQSLVAKIERNGNVQWLTVEEKTGSTHIVSADDSSVTVAGFVEGDEGSIPVIRKLDNDSNELWRRSINLREGWFGFYGGAYSARDEITSIVVLATRRDEESEQQNLHIVRMSADGEQVSTEIQELPSHRKWKRSVVRQFGNEVILAVTSDFEFLDEQYRDSFGLIGSCMRMPSTLVLRFDATNGDIKEKNEFLNIEIGDLLKDDAGRLFGAATIYPDCVVGSAAALIEVKDDKVELKYTLMGEPDSFGRALARGVNGNLILVGASERQFGPRSSVPGDDVLAASDGSVTERIADSFIAEFSSVDSEPATRWLQAGASLTISADALFGEKLLLVGSSGQQPYWILTD